MLPQNVCFSISSLITRLPGLFLYVGVETVSLVHWSITQKELGLEGAANYAWIAPIGIVIGYICGIIFIPKYLSQATALKFVLSCHYRFIVGSTNSEPYIYLFYFIHGIRMFINVAGTVAACHGRPRQVYQSRLIIAYHAMFGGAVIPTCMVG